MKLIGEVEIEKNDDDDILLLVNLFEKLKEINEKIDELSRICESLTKEVRGDPDDRR